MLLHVGFHVLVIAKEANVHQLADFIVADGLVGKLVHHIADVPPGGGHRRQTRPGEGDFGGGAENKDHVLLPLLLQEGEEIQQLVPLLVEVVDGVGVVPKDAEIPGGGPEPGEPPHHPVGIGDAGGIGILGNAPDALYRRVLHQLLHLVHIRALRGHVHIHHPDAEMLGDGEVPVVPRHRAEEFDLRLLAPGLIRAVHPGKKGPGHAVVHHVEAGIASHDNLVLLHPQHIRQELSYLRQAVQKTVVAAVDAAFGHRP